MNRSNGYIESYISRQISTILYISYTRMLYRRHLEFNFQDDNFLKVYCSIIMIKDSVETMYMKIFVAHVTNRFQKNLHMWPCVQNMGLLKYIFKNSNKYIYILFAWWFHTFSMNVKGKRFFTKKCKKMLLYSLAFLVASFLYCKPK
jgi:hypothetical protein